jgi:superfamily II DNA helicase RecQ
MPKAARKPVATANPAVAAVLGGGDLLLTLPSGGTPSWLDGAAAQARRPALLVVPSELVVEREARLGSRVATLRIDGLLRPAEREQALERVRARGALIVLSDPEALEAPEVRDALTRVRVAFVVVEQAQRASSSSPDFDPAFALLAATLARFSSAPRAVVLSAATAAVRRDVERIFSLRSPQFLAAPVCPESVTLQTIHASAGDAAFAELVSSLPRPGVLFCATPQEADSEYAALRARRVPVHRYHAAMSAGERGGELIQFTLPGRRAVLVATSAFAPAPHGASESLRGFGLGFENRELNFVAHCQAPASLEQYAREIGLAARARAATCVLAHDPGASRPPETELQNASPSAGEVFACATALAVQSAVGYTTLERLALDAGIGRRAAELAVTSMARAGLVKHASGWVRPRLAGGALVQRATELATSLDQARLAGAQRLDAVEAYAASRGCLVAFLADYFGLESAARCGRCSGCVAPRTRRGSGRRGSLRVSARVSL